MREKYWTHEMIQREANRFTYKADFKKHAFGVYANAKREGILDKVCSHMSIDIKEDEILEELSRQSRGGFWKK